MKGPQNVPKTPIYIKAWGLGKRPSMKEGFREGLDVGSGRSPRHERANTRIRIDRDEWTLAWVSS